MTDAPRRAGGSRRGAPPLRRALTAFLLGSVGLTGGCDDAVPEETPIIYQAADMADGTAVSLADLRGRAVLLASWATWCAPCRVELPKLQALYEAQPDEGLLIVAVNVDAPDAAQERIDAMIAEFGLTMPIWRDDGDRFTPTFRGFGVPMTVLVGHDGTIVETWYGTLRTSDPAVISSLEAAVSAAKQSSR